MMINHDNDEDGDDHRFINYDPLNVDDFDLFDSYHDYDDYDFDDDKDNNNSNDG